MLNIVICRQEMACSEELYKVVFVLSCKNNTIKNCIAHSPPCQEWIQ